MAERRSGLGDEFVLRGATILDRGGRRRADVAVRDGLIAALGQENRHLILMFWDTSSGRLRGRAMSHFIHSK